MDPFRLEWDKKAYQVVENLPPHWADVWDSKSLHSYYTLYENREESESFVGQIFCTKIFVKLLAQNLHLEWKTVLGM